MVDTLPLVLVVAAFTLHLIGEHRAAAGTGRPRARRARQRALIFYAGLLTIAVALTGPLNTLARELFWAQMIQRLLLLAVASPLIVLGRPWLSLRRPFPPGWRRFVAQALARPPIRGLSRALARAPGAWLAFNVNLLFWHLPGPNDLTLQNPWAHLLASGTFLLFGILFWTQLTRAGLLYSQRIGYTAAAMLINVGLAIFLAFAQHPLYSPYAQLAHRPGGISALADQQIGGGIMWTAGDVPFTIAISLLVQRWLATQEAMTRRLFGGLGAEVAADSPRAVATSEARLIPDWPAAVASGPPQTIAAGPSGGNEAASGQQAVAPPPTAASDPWPGGA
jgi:putative membrane protein